MSRSLLAMVRGPDGRSLAWALVLLLTLSTVFGAFSSAGIAGAGWDASLPCGSGLSTNGAGAPAIPTPDDHASCCTLGCGPSQAGALAVVEGVPPPMFPARGISPPADATSPAVVRRPASAGPRGPPVLA